MALNSKFFTLDELTLSHVAVRRGIANVPDRVQLDNLQLLVSNILDPLREHLGRPVVVNSGFRNAAVNKAVGGSATSQHIAGQAADIVVPGMNPSQVIEAIRDLGLPFDQLIHEFGSWTHVSYSSHNRRQVLKAAIVNGRTKYSALA